MVEAGGQAAAFKTGVQGDVLTLNVVGDWRAAHLGSIDDALRDYADDTTGRELIVGLSGLKRLDSTGA